MSESTGERVYGCLFCRSGREDHILADIQRFHPQTEAIVPKRKRIRRMGGVGFEEEAVLFPGYIFFRVEDDGAKPRYLLRVKDSYRVLENADGDWRLHGPDLAMAKMLFEEGGVVGFSKAYYVGDRIRIQEGMLKAYEGAIERVNKRARTAQVRIDLQGKIMRVWLGFELIDEPEGIE